MSAFLANGCATDTHSLEVITEPSAARIYINGVHVGESPRKVKVSFADFERVYIQTSRKGYEPTLDVYTEDTLPDDGRWIRRLRRN